MRGSTRAATAVAAVLVLGLVAVAAVGAKGRPKHAPAKPVAPAIQHVVVIMLENHSKSSVLGDANAPYINQLAGQYAVAENYYGVTHPSQPNYVAAISGSNWGVNDDQPTNTYDHRNLVDELEAHRLTWAAYMESMPSAGFTGPQYPSNAALYVNKHDPFVLFDDVRNSPARLQHVKPYSDFAADMRKGMPSFVWISPNQCHDMHGGVFAPVASDGSDGTPCPYGSAKDDANDAALKRKADDFVKGAMQAIQASPVWKSGRVAVFVVTDENDFTGDKSTDGWESAAGCCDSPNLGPGTPFLGSNGKPDGNVWGGGVYGGGLIPAVVVVNKGGRPAGYTSSAPYNHYSLLLTVERNFKLGELGYTSDSNQVHPMTEFFGSR